jgi:hypothetical protein
MRSGASSLKLDANASARPSHRIGLPRQRKRRNELLRAAPDIVSPAPGAELL